jgi:hypothetical protein
MKNKLHLLVSFFVMNLFVSKIIAQELYKAPSNQIKTIWVSPENPTGAKGNAGQAEGARGAGGGPFPGYPSRAAR